MNCHCLDERWQFLYWRRKSGESQKKYDLKRRKNDTVMSICVKPGQRGIIGTVERRLKLWITNSIGIMFLSRPGSI